MAISVAHCGCSVHSAHRVSDDDDDVVVVVIGVNVFTCQQSMWSNMAQAMDRVGLPKEAAGGPNRSWMVSG